MKKKLLLLLISLNLAMPAHAVIGTVLVIGGPMPAIVITTGGIGMTSICKISSKCRVVAHYNPVLAWLMIGGMILDGEKNSENKIVQVNIAEDIDALIAAGIYTEIEGDALKSEWRAFESEKKSYSVHVEKLKGMSPSEVVATIQSEADVSELLAEYFASKMSVQVQ